MEGKLFMICKGNIILFIRVHICLYVSVET